MEANYYATTIYGVHLSWEESEKLKELSAHRYNELCNHKLIHRLNHFETSCEDTIIIGVLGQVVNEGDCGEIDFSSPMGESIDEVLDTLDLIGVYRDPTWHLLCQIT